MKRCTLRSTSISQTTPLPLWPPLRSSTRSLLSRLSQQFNDLKGEHRMTQQEKVPFDMKLEVVVIGVSDIDRAKAFYESLGWRLDIDYDSGAGFRALQVTPHNSDASIIFGKGITSAKPGSVDGLVLAVTDVVAARDDLAAR